MCATTVLTSFEPGAVSAAREALIRSLLDFTGEPQLLLHVYLPKYIPRLDTDFTTL
jgi:hypothetical protein